jgi:hypothetical protein
MFNSETVPDPVWHARISFIKSAVRIAAGIALIWPQSLILAGILIIIAEVLGIAEELV